MESVEKASDEIDEINSIQSKASDAESLENNENESGDINEQAKRKRLNKTEKKKLKFQRLLEKYKQKKEEKKKQRELERLEKEAQKESEEPKENKSDVLYETYYNKRELKKLMLERLKKCYDEENSDKLKICIDCAFVEKMSQKELSRLSQQIGRCYATNKTLAKPVFFTLANLGTESKLYKELCRVNDGFANYVLNRTEKSVEDYFDGGLESVAYLSPDASEFLEDVDASVTYVIGGLVDETVAKKVTFSKCEEKKIKSFALPIEKFMMRRVNGQGELDLKNFNYNKILTINQVFDILTNKFEGKEWPEALGVGVPKRKGFYVENNNNNKQPQINNNLTDI